VTFSDDLALLVKILRLTPKNECHTHWAQGLSASRFLLSASLFLRFHYHLSVSLFGLSLQRSWQSQISANNNHKDHTNHICGTTLVHQGYHGFGK